MDGGDFRLERNGIWRNRNRENPFAKPDTRAVNAGGTSATGILHRIADGGFERDFEVALDG